jgi:putative ABC transport system permease protein
MASVLQSARLRMLGEGVAMAFVSLRANKLRSALTIVGVVVGVTTLVGMVALIQGLNASTSRQIRSLGSDVIYITIYGPGGPGSLPDSLRNRKQLTVDDAAAIQEFCPAVEEVSPGWDTSLRLTYHGKTSQPMETVGASASYQETNNVFVEKGRFFTAEEVRRAAPVAVLGTDAEEAVFTGDPVGKLVRLGGTNFTIVGVLEKRGKFLGDSWDDVVVIPYTTSEKRFGTDQYFYLAVKARGPAYVQPAIDQVTELLRRRRGVRVDQPDDFAVMTSDTFLKLYKQITGGFFMVLVLISSIALLVGGIGVMNIMLVSVRERTHEIGMRKAIGARRRDILWQFLVESSTLTAVGGLVGVILGLLLAGLVSLVTHLPSGVPVWTPVVGVAFSMVVGLFFGTYPALKAASLDPVEALRYE